MIVVDIETSGIDYTKNGIIQIGAIDLLNPSNKFYGECRIDKDEKVSIESSEVIGWSVAKMRDNKMQSLRQLLRKFFMWCETCKLKNLLCHNPQFDFAFIKTKAEKYNMKLPFHFRCFDAHTIASYIYLLNHKNLLVKDNHSDFTLGKVLNLCGIEDNRGSHNALEDAKLTAECASRMLFGKKLLDEYKKFSVPNYLIK